ncbi:DMT family transporter [Sulfitobacter sp. M57]|uniref:DMT family transporter n=1 Tax=unclassified Sulfitobacter TaxID=196795 RepID=UPI0023E20354|nr:MULTISPECIES: DMT family transporter [unclassified Sulfitobacter]MDF3416228.1 DMT family transporter [Sulfitobacter sp. KE5]MDF3423707.1 DMT family transporter [Sulfitobacter sp. KE43]MDF3434774.1 DMT family transporter [Sulfitobacter sp. KE42]MDF3460413.1 DMT family transporter [Sulfitobacter sp. S74]MDF3464311.1 DMT family transporter [Sulfitobacter sp. Ks18]
MSQPLLGHLAMLAFSALVAGSFSLGSLMANEIDPTAFTAVRFWLAAAFVGILAQMRGGLGKGSFTAPWRYFVLGGLFGIYFVLMFEGLKVAPPVSAAAVFTLVPLMAAGFAWVLLRQVLTPRMALALAIGGAGALWVVFRADLDALLRFDIGQGEAIYFIGCVAHAIYTPMVRRLNRGEAVVTFTFGTVLAGACLLTVYAWSDIFATSWTSLPLMVWVTLFYTAFFATAVTVVLLQFATLRLPSAKVMAYTYLTPSWVIIWEIGLGNGAPPTLILAGVALTVLALLLLLRDDSAKNTVPRQGTIRP